MQMMGHVSSASDPGMHMRPRPLRQIWVQLPTCAIAAPQRCQELIVAEEAHPLGTRLPRKDKDLRGAV